jgi:hypothetical protein
MKDSTTFKDDWRDRYFENRKLANAIARLEKLGADTEYVSWLIELVRRADTHIRKPPPIKRVTAHLSPWPAISGAAQLASAKSPHDFGVKVGELRYELRN